MFGAHICYLALVDAGSVILYFSIKGKKSEILQVIPDEQKVICKDINIVHKHMKQTEHIKGGIIKKEYKMPWSKIMLLDSKGKPSKIAFHMKNKKEKILVVSLTFST